MEIQSVKKHESADSYKIKQSYKYISEDYWEWSVWIESSEKGLDKIENVIYNLHYTFREPVRQIKNRQNKFKLDASGWGTFTIYAIINFKDSTILELEHELELHYPDGEPNTE